MRVVVGAVLAEEDEGTATEEAEEGAETGLIAELALDEAEEELDIAVDVSITGVAVVVLAARTVSIEGGSEVVA